MKYLRLIFSTFVLLFGFSLVLFSATRLSSKATQARAQSPSVNQEELGEEIEVEENGQEREEVDYYLPYPGILPDHPLYWLKMVRDRVRLWLTREAEARFDRLLLYADKRLGATKALTEGGQADLGVTTATKAEKYLEQAVTQFGKVEEVGKALPEKVDHLEKAIAKHEEVLREIKEKVPDQARPAIDQAIEKAVMQRERIRERFRIREEKKEQGEEKNQEQIQNQEQTQVQEGEMEQQQSNQGKEEIESIPQQKGGD